MDYTSLCDEADDLLQSLYSDIHRAKMTTLLLSYEQIDKALTSFDLIISLCLANTVCVLSYLEGDPHSSTPLNNLYTWDITKYPVNEEPWPILSSKQTQSDTLDHPTEIISITIRKGCSKYKLDGYIHRVHPACWDLIYTITLWKTIEGLWAHQADRQTFTSLNLQVFPQICVRKSTIYKIDYRSEHHQM